MAETTYIVFRLVPSDEDMTGPTLWEMIDEGVPASSVNDAIRQTAAAQTAQTRSAGTWAATPMRSWKPVQVEAVQTTVLKLSKETP